MGLITDESLPNSFPGVSPGGGRGAGGIELEWAERRGGQMEREVSHLINGRKKERETLSLSLSATPRCDWWRAEPQDRSSEFRRWGTTQEVSL